MPNEDIGLLFDNSSFIRGFDAIDRRLKGMAGHMGSLGRVMTFSIMKAEIAVHALGAAWRGIGNVIQQQMPEVGAVFGTVKDIFFRNFLFPLRQQVLPLLQRLLDWTREHRAAFVQWGQTAVAAFQLVWNIVSSGFALLKRFWEGIQGAVFRIFGIQAKNFSEAINMVIFKISVVANAASILLEPIIDGLAKFISAILPPLAGILEDLAKIAWAALSGFIEGISKHAPELAAAFQDLGKAFHAAFTPEVLAVLRQVFEILGEATILAITTAIELLAKAFQLLADVIDALQGKKVDWSNLIPHGPVFDTLYKVSGQIGTAVADAVRAAVHGGLQAGGDILSRLNMGPGGGAGPIQPMPYGGPEPWEMGGGHVMPAPPARSSAFYFNMNLNVTEGNSYAAGRNVARGFFDQLKGDVLDTDVRRGK